MPDKIKKIYQKQDGMVLIMAIMILSLMMTSAMILSRIIISEVKMTINTGNSVSSFYSAESGIEKGLYYIKYAREYGSLTPFDNLYQYSASFGNNQSFQITQASSSRPTFAAYNITTSSPAHLDVIDPSGNISGGIDWDTGSAISHDYSVSWGVTDCFPSHASDRLEVTIYSFDENVFTDDLSNSSSGIDKKIVICNCDYANGDACSDSINSFPITDNKFYRFSFRPLDSTVAYLNFDITGQLLAGGSYATGIPSEMTIVSQGTYRNSNFRIKAETPALAPVSDVFSYVIFSEEAILKNF